MFLFLKNKFEREPLTLIEYKDVHIQQARSQLRKVDGTSLAWRQAPTFFYTNVIIQTRRSSYTSLVTFKLVEIMIDYNKSCLSPLRVVVVKERTMITQEHF